MSPDEHIPSHEELIDRLDEALNNYTRSLRTKIDRLEKQLELERQMSKKQDPLKDIPLTGKIDFAAEQRAAENLTMKDAAKKSVQGGPITKAGAGKKPR